MSDSSHRLDLSHPSLQLSFLPTRLSILQFSPTRRIPRALVELATAPGRDVPFVSITRTRAEVSIIVETDRVVESSGSLSSDDEPVCPIESSGPWIALVVKGPMDLSLTGILHALTGPLRDAHVPVFASSTWDTDYVLVNADKRDDAKAALVNAGWTFEA
ncbi:hypothetical protein JCM11491_006655 [Sporobolomyces phaffii]